MNPSNSARIRLTPDQVRDASQRGTNRQNYATERKLQGYMFSSTTTHIRGCLAEAAVAQFLGIELDPDWTLAADWRRKCDIPGGFHVRSSRNGDAFMWKPGKDYPSGIWFFCATRESPVITIAGFLRGSECKELVEPRVWQDQTYHVIPASKLRPLPEWTKLRTAA